MQETHVGKKAVYFNVNEELKKRLKMTLETTVGGKTKKRSEVKKKKNQREVLTNLQSLAGQTHLSFLVAGCVNKWQQMIVTFFSCSIA